MPAATCRKVMARPRESNPMNSRHVRHNGSKPTGKVMASPLHAPLAVLFVCGCVCVVVCCLWCSYFLCVCCCLDTAILIALRLSLHRNTTNTIDSKAIDKEYPIHTSDAWPSMRKQLHGVLAVPPNRHGSPNHLHLKLEINHNLVLMC